MPRTCCFTLRTFAALADPRYPRGRHHPLAVLISLTAVALLAGMKRLEAIAPFARDQRPALPLGPARKSR